MHKWEVSDKLTRLMQKISKRDKSLYEQLLKKIDEIVNCYSLDHYKNLMYNLKDSKRVHIGHFVLVFQYDRKLDLIRFDDFDHHDKIYIK